MGTILPVLPLWQACWENARNAAYKDPRFLPVEAGAGSGIRFEIVVMETPRPFMDISQLGEGECGIILSRGFRREVFLPGSFRFLPGSMEELLQALRRRADMDGEDQGTPEVWEVFGAEVISEEDPLDPR
jgi:AMMECR1 domain-containing protein